jgi:hypothetical protein
VTRRSDHATATRKPIRRVVELFAALEERLAALQRLVAAKPRSRAKWVAKQAEAAKAK